MENNELSPPDLEQPSEVSATPEPRPVSSKEDLWDRLESEAPEAAEALADNVASQPSSDGEAKHERGIPDQETISMVQKNLAPLRDLSQRVERLNSTRNEFNQALNEIQKLYDSHEISEQTYQQALFNAKAMDVDIRSEALSIRATHDNLQNHYSEMTQQLEKQFPTEWAEKNRKATTNKIFNICSEKLGIPKEVIIEAVEVPGILSALTKITQMDAELTQLKKEALRRNTNQPVPMASKLANITQARDKRMEQQNNLVGYTGKKGQAEQLDKISALLRQTGM